MYVFNSLLSESVDVARCIEAGVLKQVYCPTVHSMDAATDKAISLPAVYAG